MVDIPSAARRFLEAETPRAAGQVLASMGQKEALKTLDAAERLVTIIGTYSLQEKLPRLQGRNEESKNPKPRLALALELLS